MKVIMGVSPAALLLIDSLAAPATAYRRMQGGRSWAVPLTVYAIISPLVAYLAYSTFVRAAVGSEMQVGPRALQAMQVGAYAVVLSAPFFFIARVLVVAALLWVGMVFSGLDLRFRSLVGIVSLAQVAYFVHVLCSVIVAKLSGNPNPVAVEFGLNLLVTGNATLARELASVNVFSIWYLYLISQGIAVEGNTTLARGFLACLPFVIAYLGTLAVGAIISSGRGMF